MEQRNRDSGSEITERARAEAALRTSEGKYLDFVQHVPVGIVITTPDGRVYYMNAYAQQMLGYSSDDLNQLNVEAVYVRSKDRTDLLMALEEEPLEMCPWVGEAWESGQPVVVSRQRLENVGLGHWPIQVILEVPPQTGGSMGVNSRKATDFDEDTIRTVKLFAGTDFRGDAEDRGFKTREAAGGTAAPSAEDGSSRSADGRSRPQLQQPPDDHPECL